MVGGNVHMVYLCLFVQPEIHHRIRALRRIQVYHFRERWRELDLMMVVVVMGLMGEECDKG